MPLISGLNLICVALIAGLLFSADLPTSTSDSSISQDDEEAVRYAFSAYRDAIIARDGKAAYDRVDQNTRSYYDRICDLVKYGSEEELVRLSFTDLTIILSSRQFIPMDQLEIMDGAALFTHAVDRGWTDRELVVAGVGDIEFGDGVAYGRALLNQVHTLFHWIFRLENGAWRIDLMSQMDAIDAASREMLSREGLSPADLAYAMLVRGAGADDVSPAIWQPPLRR